MLQYNLNLIQTDRKCARNLFDIQMSAGGKG